jgi:carbamoyl-phosphate synthase/aspartate carbamoyltransferase
VLLRRYDDVTINLVAPAPSLALPSSLRSELEARGQLGLEAETLTPEIVGVSDVLYVTRTQKERFASVEEYEAVKDKLVVDNKVLRWAKSKMVVMHPLPRNNEIAPEVDWDLRAAYFRQVGRALRRDGG